MTATTIFRPAVVATSLALAAVSLSRSARAEDALAETLYQEGRRAAQAKDWELACKKFRESHDREPAPGALLNLADCEEHRGLLTDAIAHFEAASKLFRDERGAFAKQRAVAIEARLPRLTIRERYGSVSACSTGRCPGAPVPTRPWLFAASTIDRSLPATRPGSSRRRST